jgi:hypothetical protein
LRLGRAPLAFELCVDTLDLLLQLSCDGLFAGQGRRLIFYPRNLLIAL